MALSKDRGVTHRLIMGGWPNAQRFRVCEWCDKHHELPAHAQYLGVEYGYGYIGQCNHPGHGWSRSDLLREVRALPFDGLTDAHILPGGALSIPRPNTHETQDMTRAINKLRDDKRFRTLRSGILF